MKHMITLVVLNLTGYFSFIIEVPSDLPLLVFGVTFQNSIPKEEDNILK